jgi:hypothetical protein
VLTGRVLKVTETRYCDFRSLEPSGTKETLPHIAIVALFIVMPRTKVEIKELVKGSRKIRRNKEGKRNE